MDQAGRVLRSEEERHVGTGVLAQKLSSETAKLLDCVHCGLCLSSCPTYVQLGDENDSPRGRLYLMRAVGEGRLQPSSEAFTKHIDLCLGCLACETVCPAGVRYGQLLESSRAEIATSLDRKKTLGEKVLRFILRRLFISPQLLHWSFFPMRLLRRSRLARFLLLRRFVPQRIERAAALLFASRPLALREPSSEQLVDVESLSKNGIQNQRRVVLFAGCVARELFEHTNEATVKTLEHNGCFVLNPRTQHCCGALHAHAGEQGLTRLLARKNIDAFQKSGAEAVIVNVAGCGAMLKQYGELLADDEDYRGRAKHFASSVRDISEYLVEIDFEPGASSIDLKVTYDAPCHLHHAQGVTSAPLELIAKIKGVEFVPLADSDTCCGSAGIYNLINPELADQILDSKLQKIRQTGANVVLTGNAGCLMHIASGAQRAGLEIGVMHPVELLALTYE